MPEADRQASDSQSRKASGNLSPRDGILHQTVSRLPVANQVFLGSWTVDIHQEGCSLRSGPQRRHTACLRWCSYGAPRKWSGWDRGGDKMHHTPGIVRSPSTWSPEFLRPGEGHRSLCLCGVPKNLNLSSLDLGSPRKPGPALDSALQSTLEPEQCRPGKHTPPSAGANPVWSIYCEHSPHMPVIFAYSLPTSHSTTG